MTTTGGRAVAYLVWRRGRYAELVQAVREGNRVRQVRLAYLGARPRLTPALKARVEQRAPGAVDWGKVEAEIRARGGVVAAEDDYGLPEGPRPILWAYFEALRRGLLFADEPAPWDNDGAPPQRPVTVADRDAYRYLWPRFVRAMLARPDLRELLRDPQRLRQETWRVFDELRNCLSMARAVREGQQRIEDVARYFPERLSLVQELLGELAKEDEAARARERARAARTGRV